MSSLHTAAATLLALGLAGGASAQCPDALYHPPNPSNELYYGASTAATADVVVSAVTGPQPAALVRRRLAGGALGPIERLDLAGASPTGFGNVVVAAEGDLIAVAFFDAIYERTVHVFRDGPGGYVFEAELVPTTPTEFDGYGQTMAVSDGRVLVGAPYTDVAGENRSGQVLLFEELSGAWQETAVFQQRVPSQDSFFGRGLDLHGDLVAINERNPVGSSAGPQLGVSLYRESATGWELEAAIPYAGPDSGFAIALGDDVAIVGAPGYFSGGLTTPSALVYRPINGLWSLRQVLTPPSGNVSGFGRGLEFDGETLVVLPTNYLNQSTGAPVEVFRDQPFGSQLRFAHRATLGAESFGASGPRQVVPVGDSLYAGLPRFGTNGAQGAGAILSITTEELAEVICTTFSTPSGFTSGNLRVERGCPSPLLGDFTLRASPLPGGSFAMLVVGTTAGSQSGVFGGPDTLCALGSIGRGQVRSIPPLGAVTFNLDIGSIPQPSGPVAAVSGSSWVAQVVYRDPTSGTGRATDALRFLVP